MGRLFWSCVQIFGCRACILGQEIEGLQNMNIILRCHLHSAQRTLENAIDSEPRAQNLLDLLVRGSSPSTDVNDLGGFCRAVRNSYKLQHALSESVATMQGLQNVDTKLASLRSAPQRFDTIMQCCVTIAENTEGILRTLLCLETTDARKSKWVQKLLPCFDTGNLIMIGLLAELSSICAKYHHQFDNAGGHGMRSNASRLARTAHWFQQLELALNRTFYFQSLDGQPQEPLVLSADYTRGYFQQIQRSTNLLVGEAVIQKGKMKWYRAGLRDQGHLREAVARELGSVHNIIKCYLAGLRLEHTQGVALALQVFDIAWWSEDRCDDTLQGPQFFIVNSLLVCASHCFKGKCRCSLWPAVLGLEASLFLEQFLKAILIEVEECNW